MLQSLEKKKYYNIFKISNKQEEILKGIDARQGRNMYVWRINSVLHKIVISNTVMDHFGIQFHC